MHDSDLHERLKTVAGDRSFRKLAEITGAHPETVRRYMQGQSPSIEFVASLCKALGVSGSWMLTGAGPMWASEIKTEALRQADPGELLSAMSNTLTQLIERVGRLEVYTQTLETRIRGVTSSHHGDHTHGHERQQSGDPDERAEVESPSPTVRARRIAGAVAQRPRPDAD